MRSSTLLVLATWALNCGCSGDKASVALSAHVEGPTLDVESGTLGASVTGGFNLTMALGEYASGDTQVSLGVFSLERGDVDILSPLPLSGARFPVALGVGKSITLPLTFDTESPPDVGDELCADTVQLRGTLTDSLSHDHPTVVTSPAFSAQCN